MSKRSRVVVLAEDEHHGMLVRRYLKKCGLNQYDMRIKQSPSGRGSAESWVRREFVKETDEYRKRQARARSALIAMIDADTHTVQDRLAQLNQALRDSGKQAVDETEQVARLVAKRNVETWILCLNDETVDEETNYTETRDDWKDLIPTASEALHDWIRPQVGPPRHCVDSLRVGDRELKRLPF